MMDGKSILNLLILVKESDIVWRIPAVRLGIGLIPGVVLSFIYLSYQQLPTVLGIVLEPGMIERKEGGNDRNDDGLVSGHDYEYRYDEEIRHGKNDVI